MTSSSNKLVDKYQYNDSQIRQQGLGIFLSIFSLTDHRKTHCSEITVHTKKNLYK
jgi:hypothetical protein